MDSTFTKETEIEIKKKGFSVYDYISLDELLMTVRKDYLDILSKINIPFGIISIILGVISYSSGFTALIAFLLVSYCVIFCILFFRLIIKTYYFLLLKNVVLTMKGVILGKELYAYGENGGLQKKLKTYEKIFLEYLGGKSQLEDYIDSKKKDLISVGRGGKVLTKISDIMKNSSYDGGGGDIGKLLLPAIASVILYVVFMYIFYYLGYFFGYILTKIYSVFIKGILFFRGNIEYKIKNKTEKIDENIKKMNRVYTLLDTKFSEFSNGDISEIAQFTKRNFDSFYTEIFSIYKDKGKLEDLIVKGGFNDFINFKLFEKYLKTEFNKPVTSMIKLLKEFKKKLQNNLAELEKTVASDKALSGTLKTKQRILENNLNLILVHIAKLEKSII